MITKTAERLVEIERELGTVWVNHITGLISRTQANTAMQELEEEKERLWALEA